MFSETFLQVTSYKLQVTGCKFHVPSANGSLEPVVTCNLEHATWKVNFAA